jgi:hypothetical protein
LSALSHTPRLHVNHTRQDGVLVKSKSGTDVGKGLFRRPMPQRPVPRCVQVRVSMARSPAVRSSGKS